MKSFTRLAWPCCTRFIILFVNHSLWWDRPVLEDFLCLGFFFDFSLTNSFSFSLSFSSNSFFLSFNFFSNFSISLSFLSSFSRFLLSRSANLSRSFDLCLCFCFVWECLEVEASTAPSLSMSDLLERTAYTALAKLFTLSWGREGCGAESGEKSVVSSLSDSPAFSGVCAASSSSLSTISPSSRSSPEKGIQHNDTHIISVAMAYWLP